MTARTAGLPVRDVACRPLEAWTPDGVRVSVQDWQLGPAGARRQRDLLLIHGLSQSHRCWFKQLAGPLRERFRIVTYDLRGHGGSARPPERAFYQDGARWGQEVRAVIETSALQRPVIVAWSYGGRIALDYLRECGSREVSGLVMVAGTASDHPSLFGDQLPLLQRMAAAQPGPEDAAASSEFLRRCLVRPLTDAEHGLMLRENLKTPPWVRAAMAGRAGAYEPVLRSLRIPVLAIHGAQDRINLPQMARYTATVCPNGRELIYEGVGHAPFWEVPERFDKDVADWLDSLPDEGAVPAGGGAG